MSSYIPFNVHSDVYVPSDVVAAAISKVWSFLNRKKAMMGEKPLKERKIYLKRQQARLFSNLPEESRPGLEEVQHYVAYNESLPFGGGHLTLQDAFRRLAAAHNIRDEETGTLLDAAIVTAVTERIRLILHDKKVRARTKGVDLEVAPLTSDKNPHRWSPDRLYFTHLSRLEAASDMFAKSTEEEVDKWTKVVVQDVSLEPDPPVEVRVQAKVEMISAADAQAKARETQALVEANKMFALSSPEMKDAMARARKAEHAPLTPAPKGFDQIEADSNGSAA